MKSPRGDEEDVIRLDLAVPGLDRAPLDDREQVALDAFARDISTHGFGSPRYLIQFVNEHDAVLFNVIQSSNLDILLVDQLARFFFGQ